MNLANLANKTLSAMVAIKWKSMKVTGEILYIVLIFSIVIKIPIIAQHPLHLTMHTIVMKGILGLFAKLVIILKTTSQMVMVDAQSATIAG